MRTTVEYDTGYEMDSLIPIVAKLAEKYTGGESTSISYERAEQLMEAVLYCIRQGQQEGERKLPAGELPLAQAAYETGVRCVEQKVKVTLQLYNQLAADFKWYGNQCLYDTFVNGMPEFFKWYDVQFAPQETILTLDYPIQKDLSGFCGIDRIFEYLKCIRLEQNILKSFPEEEILLALETFHPGYGNMIENLCEAVALSGVITEGRDRLRYRNAVL